MTYAKNPFNVTKAVDYSDAEIDKFWVDMPTGNGFYDIVKPTVNMPQIILGGKGSGKTHIMRYFSSSLQKIRHSNSLIASIEHNQYVGIFLRCGGLNSAKFSGNDQPVEAWKNIFGYYFELWLAQLVVSMFLDMVKESGAKEFSEKRIIDELHQQFDKEVKDKFATIEELASYLRKLQREIDFEVNNCAISGKQISDLRILVSPGRLIFGLPRILSLHYPGISEIKFLYLLDEYENLQEYQQQYINTLIREREDPVSFRIGGRWYGIKTYKTFSGDEELKEGSEYEKTVIDQVLRDRKDIYEKFAKSILLKRLEQNDSIGILLGNDDEKFNGFLETFSLSGLFAKIKNKDRLKSQPYLKLLATSLQGKLDPIEIKEILHNLEYPKDPLIERTNVFLFYREWSSGNIGLVNASRKILAEAKVHNVDPWLKSNMHRIVLDKFKQDIIDQLQREYREPLSYAGIDKIIKMSAGIPRLFLIMLKHIYRWSIYNGEIPYKDGPIPEATQLRGIEDAIKWFLDDARIPGKVGSPVATIIDRIGQLLHEVRFSDAPPECSLCAFSINSTDISPPTQQLLDYLEQYSYLIKVTNRREKNSSVYRITYQVNGLIAPRWELPIYRRGVLHLSSKEVTAIFDPRSEDAFIKIKAERKSRYNAPFKVASTTLSLFE